MRSTLPPLNTCTVAVIGLGYVGLPLAVEFSKNNACLLTGKNLKRKVIGFDVNSKRIAELRAGIDSTNEITTSELEKAESLEFTDDKKALSSADVFVVTVPTPIDAANRPDLSPLEKASLTIGEALKERTSGFLPVVIYESTVYPGATEEVCVPILESQLGESINNGFVCGYSPERINPGDRNHKLTSITKVTSGSTVDSACWAMLYGLSLELEHI